MRSGCGTTTRRLHSGLGYRTPQEALVEALGRGVGGFTQETG